MDVERRIVLRTLAQFAVAAVPLRCGLLASPHVDVQPLLSQARRIIDAMRSLGEPFPDSDLARLRTAEDSGNEAAIRAAI